MGPMPVLFDSHCHLDDPAFDGDRESVIRAARAAGVARFLLPGVGHWTWPRQLALAAREPGFHCALGLHPLFLERHRLEDLERLAEALDHPRVVAVGEVGLDFYHKDADRTAQQALFEAQVRLARERGLPLVLHVRRAHDPVLATLRRLRFPHGGICHACNASLQQARQYLDLGFRLGFGGPLTYPGSRRIRALAAELPSEALCLETDAPDLPPVTHRGERNSPAHLPEILSALAELRGTSPETLAEITYANACQALRVES